jgi:hypothetical protein
MEPVEITITLFGYPCRVAYTKQPNGNLASLKCLEGNDYVQQMVAAINRELKNCTATIWQLERRADEFRFLLHTLRDIEDKPTVKQDIAA